MGQLEKKRKMQIRISTVEKIIADIRNSGDDKFSKKKKSVLIEMYKNEIEGLKLLLSQFSDDDYDIMMADYNSKVSIQSAAKRFFKKNIEAIKRFSQSAPQKNVEVEVELTIVKGNSCNLPAERHFSRDEEEQKEFKAKVRSNGKHTAKLRGSRQGIAKAKMMVAKKLLKNKVSPDAINRVMNDFELAVDAAIAEIEYERQCAINAHRRQVWNERRLSKGMREAY